jgi:hypothetical protein
LEGDVYDRERLVDSITAELEVATERSPSSRMVWIMQAFSQGAPEYLRMPRAEEMHDLASIVYSTNIDGAMWYPWTFSDTYGDYLSGHPELYPTVREIYEDVVLPKRR